MLDQKDGSELRFIIGAGRSGTSLVYKLLSMHPDTAWISNYLARMPSFPSISALNRLYKTFPKLQLMAWFGSGGTAYTPQRRLLLRAMPNPVEGESVYTCCGIPEFPSADWQVSEQEKNKMRHVAARMQAAQGAQMLITKRTANNRRIPQMAEIFPAAKFLHIIRDGRAVAKSLLKVEWWNDHKVWWWDLKTPRQWVSEGYNPMEMAAKNWVKEIEHIDAGLEHVADENILAIHYEDLLRSPSTCLPRMAEFFGLDCDPDWLRNATDIPFANSRRSNGKQPKDDADATLVRDIQGPMLQRFGYIEEHDTKLSA